MTKRWSHTSRREKSRAYSRATWVKVRWVWESPNWRQLCVNSGSTQQKLNSYCNWRVCSFSKYCGSLQSQFYHTNKAIKHWTICTGIWVWTKGLTKGISSSWDSLWCRSFYSIRSNSTTNKNKQKNKPINRIKAANLVGNRVQDKSMLWE